MVARVHADQVRAVFVPGQRARDIVGSRGECVVVGDEIDYVVVSGTSCRKRGLDRLLRMIGLGATVGVAAAIRVNEKGFAVCEHAANRRATVLI